RMRPRGSVSSTSDIRMVPSTIEKKKLRAEQMKAAREKYNQHSRANLPPPTTTVPVGRTVASRIRPPSSSAVPSFRVDPAATAAIRSLQPSAAVTGRPSAVPSPAPRATLQARAPAPPLTRPLSHRPSLLPRDADSLLTGALFGSTASLASSSSLHPSNPSSSNFEPMGESLNQIMRNEPLPMAVGARASSIVRRNFTRPSLVPGGINIFTATGSERVEAERLQALTPARFGRTRVEESVHRTRVRFEVVESIQEQRESVGDEMDEPTSSAASALVRPTPREQECSLRRESSTLLLPIRPPLLNIPPSNDPPRSILKQKRSSRGGASSSSSTTVVASSSSISNLASSSLHSVVSNENQLARGTPSISRSTPTRNGSSKKKKTKAQGMMDIFAILNRMSDEDIASTPTEMMDACMKKLMEMREKVRVETIEEGEEDTEGEESVLDRGILEDNEEEEETAEETLPLQQLELTMDGTPRPRRRSRRLASSQGLVSRSLFSD
ncbi:hypothetical protein PMAYCL1PPCAC_29045, partial [Pristionchus mayeri]